MPRIKYVDKKFAASSQALIDRANALIADYGRQGFSLTLRQLYYQFVARGLIPNKDSEYKRLGSVINDARLGGLIDWNALQDRTRYLRSYSFYEEPNEVLAGIGERFIKDLWADQEFRIEVWVEKDALVDVVGTACRPLAVPFFSCRGYTSQTEMWVAGQRLKCHIRDGHTPVIIHLGDHDPSGIDMSRDIEDRLSLFMGGPEFRRIALNKDQVAEYQPPPNPAKITDSRSTGYIAQFGDESWELDALEPQVLVDLITATIEPYRNMAAWDATWTEINEGREIFRKLESRWSEVVEFLS